MHLIKSRPKIAVVMPAYNAAAYIAESIRSILNQDFEDFELIITDDCSTDNTVDIVKSFDDPRIKALKTRSNTGSAKYPRELAIEAATASYICWIDSDDIVDVDYLSRLLQRKKETGSDIVCSQMLAERNGLVEYTLPRDGFDFQRILSGKEACMLTLSFPWEINLNGWLCDRGLWTSVSTFKSMTVNQMDADDFSAREMLFNAKQVAFSPAIYHYRLHPDAITKKITPKLFETLITYNQIIKFFQDKCPEVVPIIKNSICYRMVGLMRLYVLHEHDLLDSQKSKSIKIIKMYFKNLRNIDILRSEITPTQKLLLLMPFKLSFWVIKKINNRS